MVSGQQSQRRLKGFAKRSRGRPESEQTPDIVVGIRRKLCRDRRHVGNLHECRRRKRLIPGVAGQFEDLRAIGARERRLGDFGQIVILAGHPEGTRGRRTGFRHFRCESPGRQGLGQREERASPEAGLLSRDDADR